MVSIRQMVFLEFLKRFQPLGTKKKMKKEILTQREYYTHLFFKDISKLLDSYEFDELNIDIHELCCTISSIRNDFYKDLGERIIMDVRKEEEGQDE